MPHFRVYHPLGGEINHDLKRGQYEYEHICSVDATSIEQVFSMCQNDLSERYASLGKRSTSVGDIIEDEEGKTFFIQGRGFLEIPPTVVQYIDWGNH